jgi:hypothetical protein
MTAAARGIALRRIAGELVVAGSDAAIVLRQN